MRKVIVNSTPLIALCKTGRLHLLRDLYGAITVPVGVFEEVTKKNDSVRKMITAADWICIEHISDDFEVGRRMYSAKLHRGEIEVMLLAQSSKEEHLVIIDDDAARKTAVFLGLHLTGTLGVLIKAKEMGYIDAVMPELEKMKLHGIYISDRLQDMVREITGE